MKTILLVDDEPSFQDLLCRYFENDYHVLTSETGEDALEVIKANEVDLVMLDYIMPGINGIETLKRIKEFNKETPVIMLTGHSSPELPVTAKELGANDFITKPSMFKVIGNAISRVLNETSLKKQDSGLLTN